MKKVIFILTLIVITAMVVTGCTDSKESNPKEDSGKNISAEKKNSGTEKKKDIYKIGETAKTKSNSYGYPYEVTVNSFKLTTDDVQGRSLEDYNFDASEGAKFALVNVTIKNTGDKAFVPNQTISGALSAKDFDVPEEEDFFNERDKELKPGEEITGDLVFINDYFHDFDKVYLVYEVISEDEIKFELPVKNQ